jgi:hypothetical protein
MDVLSMNGTQYRAFKTLRGTIRLIFRIPAGRYRDGVSRGTNVSVSGGSDKTTYYASFGRSDLQVLSLEII